MSYPRYYASVEDVLQTVPSIGSLSNVNSATIASFIGQADAYINARLASAYTVPLDTSSVSYPLINVFSADLAVFRMLSRRVFTGEKVNKSQWVDRFSEVNSQLNEMAMGSLLLIDSSGTVLPRDSYTLPWSNTMNYITTFDVGDSFWQDVDEQRKTDIEGAKGVWPMQDW